MAIQIDINKVVDIVREGGAMFLNRDMAGNVEQKGLADYVTAVDGQVQAFIFERLKALLPEAQYMGEEKDNSDIDYNGTFWVLDPVDGTTNLIHDYKCSAVSLALAHEGELVLGVIYDPYRDEMYTAEKGKGAFLNGKPIHVSSAKTMEESLISVGTSPYYRKMCGLAFDDIIRVFRDVQDIRRSGCAALDLAYVACGRIEAFFERKLKLWDCGAGIVLIREAGGKALGYDGEDIKLGLYLEGIFGNASIADILAKEYLTPIEKLNA